METSAETNAGATAIRTRSTLLSIHSKDQSVALDRSDDLSIPAVIAWTAVAIALGATLRLPLALYSRFPLGDGGMFYVVVRNLLAHGLQLPPHVTYNRLNIPFDYPPLGFYAVALLHRAFGWPVLDILRVLPPLLSVATIGAFALLAFRVLPTRLGATVAVFALALDPDAFEWQIKGGGITRSPGTLFAVLFLWQLVCLYQSGRWRHVPPAAVFAALTALSHPEWTWFSAISAIVLFTGIGRTRLALAQTLSAGVIASALVAPWLLLVVGRTGLSPFLATMTGSSGQSPWYIQLTSLVEFSFSRQVLVSVPTLLGILGIIALLSRRQFLLPVWFAAIYMTTLRGPQDKALVVLALLAGMGATYVLVPVAKGRFAGLGPTRVRLPQLLPAVLVLCSLQAWFAAGASASMLEPVLTGQQRAAMTWARLHTPQNARFMIVSGSSDWAHEVVGEWFPALSDRASADTVQGSEWLPKVYAPRIKEYDAAQRCVYVGAACVTRWLRRTGRSVSYVFIAKGPAPVNVAAPSLTSHDCCGALRSALAHDPYFRRVYDGPGAVIFELEEGNAAVNGIGH